MPIYEYESLKPGKGCEKCLGRFELIQGIDEKPLSLCPSCGEKVRKIISWCRAAVVETPEENARINKKIKEYESERMWSHAAELADKHSENIGDKDLKLRALDNYRKAGYNSDSLEKHAKLDEE